MVIQPILRPKLLQRGTISGAAKISGYYPRRRRHLKKRGIISRIARRGSERLGKHRWVVERTHGWFAGLGNCASISMRRLDIHMALLKLSAAIICARYRG